MFSGQRQSSNSQDEENITQIIQNSDITSFGQLTPDNRSSLDLSIHLPQVHPDQHFPPPDWINDTPSTISNNSPASLNRCHCSTSSRPTNSVLSSSVQGNVPGQSSSSSSSSIGDNILESSDVDNQSTDGIGGCSNYIIRKIRKIEHIWEVHDTIVDIESEKAYGKAIADYCRKHGIVIDFADKRVRDKARATGSRIRRKVEIETRSKLRRRLKRLCRAVFPVIRDLMKAPDWPRTCGLGQNEDASNNEQMETEEFSEPATNNLPSLETASPSTDAFTSMNDNVDLIIGETAANSLSGCQFAFQPSTPSAVQDKGTSSTTQAGSTDNVTVGKSSSNSVVRISSSFEQFLHDMLPSRNSTPSQTEDISKTSTMQANNIDNMSTMNSTRNHVVPVSLSSDQLFSQIFPSSVSHAHVEPAVFNATPQRGQQMCSGMLTPSVSHPQLGVWSFTASPPLPTLGMGPMFRSSLSQSFDRDFDGNLSLFGSSNSIDRMVSPLQQEA